MRVVVLVLASSSLAGCGVALDFDPPDPSADAGEHGMDAGPPADLGLDAGGVDAGPLRDLGPPPADGGPGGDGGVPGDASVVDAGRSDGAVSDGGSVEGGVADSGLPDASAVDGGPGVDAGDPCGFVATVDRACTTDATCSIGLHQTNCCGTLAAVGINHTFATGFVVLESICDATYPSCGCPSGPTTTDSGETTASGSMIQVACVVRGARNVCMTYLTMRPPDGP